MGKEDGNSFFKLRECSSSCHFKCEILKVMSYLLSLGPHQLSAVEEIEKEELVRFSTHTCTEKLVCGELAQ